MTNITTENNTIFAEIDSKDFGEALLTILGQYGFGILSKTDLEAALLFAISKSSQTYQNADSYKRAELLRITDQKYRNLSRRMGMWLGAIDTTASEITGGNETEAQLSSDQRILKHFLIEAITAYKEAPDEPSVQIVIDDEIKRRNIQRALERPFIQSDGASNQTAQGIPIDLNLTGRSLVLRGSDLDKMIGRVKDEQWEKIDPKLAQEIKDKKGLDLRRTIFHHLQSATPFVAALLGF